MSLQKICKYADILDLSTHIQDSSPSDQMRTSILQNIAIAGLVESGIPYKISNGQIYIESDNGYIISPINNIYPYLSQNYRTYFTNQGLVNQTVAEQPTTDQTTTIQPTTDQTATVQPVAQSAHNSAQNDILSLNKNDLTYERCNLELTDSYGNTLRFSVHCAPLRNENDDIIIVRLKLLGKAGSYTHTEYGKTTTFDYNGISISVYRDMSKTDSFSCIFKCNNPNIVLNKINIESGGSKGNPVIYDENLELRIYPFPNIRDNNSGKMIFGNNKQGEAAFLYFIQNNGDTIASSGAERKPGFVYDNANLLLTAKWKDDTITFTAIESN